MQSYLHQSSGQAELYKGFTLYKGFPKRDIPYLGLTVNGSLSFLLIHLKISQYINIIFMSVDQSIAELCVHLCSDSQI